MRTANRVTGLAVGSLFIALGVVGLIASGSAGFATVSLAGVVATNAVLAVLHLALGAATLVPALLSQRASRGVNPWAGAAFLALGIAGLFLVGPDPNALGLTATANAVHFGASAVLLAVGLGADRP